MPPQVTGFSDMSERSSQHTLPNVARGEENSDILNSSVPSVSEEKAKQIAADCFGIQGTALNLTSERDANFRLTTDAGVSYALKFANPAEPPEITNFQTEALRHLQRKDPQLPVPKVVPTRDGRLELTLTLADGRRSVVRLLTWVEGEQVFRGGVSSALRRDIGTMLARLGKGLSDFDHPGASHEIQWDIKNASKLRPMTGAIEAAGIRAMVEAELDHFDTCVAPQLTTLRQQVIHNDLNHYNVVVAPGSSDRVGGILDFGDMVKTATVIDAAVAASYMTSLEDSALDCVADFVGAYNAVHRLTRKEVEMLRDLIVARLVTSICITQWRASRYPENAAYILRNNGPARRGMERFAALPRATVTHHLLNVCKLE